MRLPRDSREFAESLISNDVRFMIIGGHALAAHGCPRFTGDIDFWIQRSTKNARQIVAALADFGVASLGLQPSDFEAPDRVVQLGNRPNRIDILTSAKGVDFDACYASVKQTDFDGVVLPVIGLECLRTNKLAVKRLQDLADVEALDRRHGRPPAR